MARKPSKLAQQYRDVFSGPDGKAVLADIMAHCHLFAPIGPGNDFALGERNVALMIATKLNYFPHEFPALARQHNEALTYE
jgi:hypothetical protein